jgi:rhodanese-related sulfurtransferase
MTHATGSPVYAGQRSKNLFPHITLADNEFIEVGDCKVKILETPGHTLDSVCALVFAKGNENKGMFLFSGDTVQVGKTGLPENYGNKFSISEMATMLLSSWKKKLSALPEQTIILPAHGDDRLWAMELRNEFSSTIADEKINNTCFKLVSDRSAFIARIIRDWQPAKINAEEIARINRQGPALVDQKNWVGRKIMNLDGAVDNPEIFIIDVRSRELYEKSHIHGSLNIPAEGNLEYWTSALVPIASGVILHGSEKELIKACRRLKRVGFEADYLDFNQSFGNTVVTKVSAKQLNQLKQKGSTPLLVDVRFAAEFQKERINDSINVSLPYLSREIEHKLSKNEELVIVSNDSHRVGLAYGCLEKQGFSKLMTLEGGINNWEKMGFPLNRVEKRNIVTKTELSASSKKMGLPERIEAKHLLKMLKDLPENIEIVDIRPSEQIKEYNPLNSAGVDIVELVEGRKFLTGDRALIITDRDGTLALIVAGIFSQRSTRPVKVLVGGVEAIWLAQESGFYRNNTVKNESTSNDMGENDKINNQQKGDAY